MLNQEFVSELKSFLIVTMDDRKDFKKTVSDLQKCINQLSKQIIKLETQSQGLDKTCEKREKFCSKKMDDISQSVKYLAISDANSNVTLQKLEDSRDHILQNYDRIFGELHSIRKEFKEVLVRLPSEREIQKEKEEKEKEEKEKTNLKKKIEDHDKSFLKIFMYIAAVVSVFGVIGIFLKWKGIL